MSQAGEPSYADLVYEVLRTAGTPLQFQEIFDAVNRRRPITTKNPKGTIRNALSQAKILLSLGDGSYGYLPRLIAGSRLRVPLTEAKPAHHPLVYPHEVRDALWPSFFEIQKRRDTRPVTASLPNGDQADLSLQGLGTGVWGSQMPEALSRYLVELRAAAGDALLVHVTDAEVGRCEMSLERRGKHDGEAIRQRNLEIADAAEQVMRANHSSFDVFIWDLVSVLLARGLYRAEVAPDPLESILRADPRFTDSGLYGWALTARVTPEDRAMIAQRKETEGWFLSGGESSPGSEPLSPQVGRFAMERTLADLGAVLQGQEFESLDDANVFLQDLLGGGGLLRRTAASPLERAQDLMYTAWDTADRRERVRLAREALRISPDCADAYVLLAEESARGPREAVDLYADGVAAGERALGSEMFTENVGHFWGILETRPYMRARLGLAQALWTVGRRQEAIMHAWDMLRLNPGDN